MNLSKVGIIFVGAIIGLSIVAGLIAWSLSTCPTRLHAATPSPLPVISSDLPSQDWWQHAVLYQVYPRSFKDSDGDGIGDLEGITSQLEHFVDAGVDAIWLSPIFVSPMVDFGYDVSDYYNIHEEYGTMEDFEDLLEKAHDLGLKVLLDFVANHASIESEYFVRSENRDPGYEDYFVWADPLPDPDNETLHRPPSNWISLFGGSAWQWSEIRQQYYLHQFAVVQADFNFRSEAVRKELTKIMTFWLDKGVDGFRLDALPYLVEADPEDFGGRYPDNPLSGDPKFKFNELGYHIPVYSKDLLDSYELVYDWKEFIVEYQFINGGYTRALFAEACANITMTTLYYGRDDELIGAHFPFNFVFITQLTAASKARDFVYAILEWLTYMPNGGVANWVLGNHDNKRVATRFRPNMVDGMNALNMMLPGVAVTYQGEELGMRDGDVSWEDTVDVEALNRGNNETYMKYTRDPARTPFHWENSTNAGFSSADTTWLPLAEDYQYINLELEKSVDKSHYKVYQALTILRKEVTLSHGDYVIKPLSDRTLYLIRYLAGYDTLVLIFNVSDEPDVVDLSQVKYLKLPAEVYVASVHSHRKDGEQISDEEIYLEPGEAVVLRSSPVNISFSDITS